MIISLDIKSLKNIIREEIRGALSENEGDKGPTPGPWKLTWCALAEAYLSDNISSGDFEKPNFAIAMTCEKRKTGTKVEIRKPEGKKQKFKPIKGYKWATGPYACKSTAVTEGYRDDAWTAWETKKKADCD